MENRNKSVLCPHGAYNLVGGGRSQIQITTQISVLVQLHVINNTGKPYMMLLELKIEGFGIRWEGKCALRT